VGYEGVDAAVVLLLQALELPNPLLALLVKRSQLADLHAQLPVLLLHIPHVVGQHRHQGLQHEELLVVRSS
jgi:hypothetical protein